MYVYVCVCFTCVRVFCLYVSGALDRRFHSEVSIWHTYSNSKTHEREYMPTHVHTQLAFNVQLDAIYAMTICLCVRSMTIQHGCDAAVVFGNGGGHSIYRCGRCLRQGRMPGMSYYMCKYVSTCVLVSSSV